MSKHCCVGESTQSLEIPIADCPDVGEGHIDGHGCFSRFSFDTTERDDFLASGNKLFGDKVTCKSFIEAGEKPIEHVLKALKWPQPMGIPSGIS
jgi:hypothetical protein